VVKAKYRLRMFEDRVMGRILVFGPNPKQQDEYISTTRSFKTWTFHQVLLRNRTKEHKMCETRSKYEIDEQ
jgi:hypothetical protein